MLRKESLRDGRSLLFLALVIFVAGCKETGTVQVSNITFTGNTSVDSASLKTVIATQENGFLPWSRKHFFDRAEFDRDVQRIEAYYADHGYPSAKVTGVDVQLNNAKDKVALKVSIQEGAPTIIESVAFDGLDSIPADHLARVKSQIPLTVGQPRNQSLIMAAHNTVLAELRDHGFPYGTVKVVERPGSSSDRVQLTVVADPGPKAVFGTISVDGNTSVGQDVILRELTVRQGAEYRLSEITESERRLYALELFQFANITPRLPEDRSPSVPLNVTVAEGKHRRLQLALGYGSEEKARARLNWRHVNFGGGARTMDTEAKWSSLEHGFRGTLTEPYLLRSGLSLRLTGESWWASEPTHTYRRVGGRAIVTKQFSRGAAGVDRGTRNEIRASLINEYARYAITKEALDDPTLTDEFIALGLNPVTGVGNGRLSAVEVDYDRDTSGQPLDPRHGYLLSLHVESANSWLGGDFRYNEFLAEGRKYFQIGNRVVWASRVKGATLEGQHSAEIPFFKRYFVGGSTSVRGWGRYEVSPLSPSGQPLGGRSMTEMSSEVRFLVPGRISGVLFVDAGNVWAEPLKAASGLRWAVGPGLRYNTPIGPFRLDVGKQVNPIPGLLINGVPEKRTWRVHFSIGQAFLGLAADPMAVIKRFARYFGIALLVVLCLIGAALVTTQTSWFKNYLRGVVVRQAAQYLNGTLTIERLRGTVLTGIELEGVALRHEGETAVAMDKLTVVYDPITMIRQGLILKALTLEHPNVLLQRNESGWNFNRFVKTRQNTGGKGAPPLTIEELTVNGGHVTVKDRGALLEDISGLDARLRFAYHKPGVEFDIGRLSGRSPDMNIKQLAGNLRFEGGATHVSDLTVQTDRSSFVTTFGWSGGTEPLAKRMFDVTLHADRLSLPEVSVLFKPLSGIKTAPAVDVQAHGTFDSLKMEVAIASAEGTARGPLTGHFGTDQPGLEGVLDVQNVDLQHLVNRPEWKTRITGRAVFNWRFGHPTAVGTGEPMKTEFTFAGPVVEGFGYRADTVRAKGVYDAPNLNFDAAGNGYGSAATTHATFQFPATGPMSYTLAGTFQHLDMRRLPASLSLPKLDTTAAGDYHFASTGVDWKGSGTLRESVVEGARFGAGTVFEIDSTDRTLHYSAAGTVAGLDPARFSAPLDIDWLGDDRLRGLLNGSFTFDGSGRTVDSLVLDTTADLTDSNLAGSSFPQAHATMQMHDRTLSSTFAGTFQHLPGSLFVATPELADSSLNGTADASATLSVPAVGPVALTGFNGTAALTSSSIAGVAVERADVDAGYADDVADIRKLTLTGPRIEATASGALALGGEGQSNLHYDIAATDLEPIGKRFGQSLSGAAHVTGQASGPSSQLTLAGSVEGSRLRYSTTVDALAASTTYSVTVPNLDISNARVQAETTATFVTIAGMQLSRVAAKTVYGNQELSFDSSFEEPTRSLAAGGRVLIHPDHDEVHLQALNLRVGQTTWALAPGTEATGRYSPTAVTIDNFVLQRGLERVSAEGSVAIGAASANVTNDLTVRLNDVQVRDINELMLGQRRLDGLLNATAEIRGTRSDPRVQGEFTIASGSVEGVAFESFGGKASYESKAATVDVRLQQSPSAFLTAVGTVPLPAGPGERAPRTDAIDLAVKSSPIDLGLFQPATTELTNLRGQLQADLHVAGTFDAPQMNGSLEVTGGGFAVASTSVTYANALARLMFDGDRVVIDRFEVSDDDRDKLVAIGTVGIVKRSVGAMNMQMSASQFKVLDNAYGHVEIDADLRLAGESSAPQISGQLSTQNGRIEIDQLLEQLTKSPYSTTATNATTDEAGRPAEAAAPLASSLAPLPSMGIYDAATVDIHLRLPDDLVLRGRDIQTAYSRMGLGNANITVGGDLNIRKAAGGEPDVVGTVSVVRGFYEFQGRRFDVLRDSQIRFEGLKPIDPSLQVGAQRVISGVTAIVNIRGTARRPTVALTSQPPMDEADVLSLIVFNQPINQLGEGERLNLAQRAGSMAAGYIASPVANSIAGALDLDLFEIRPEGGINGQPSVALGQQFGSRLFVQFKQDFGSADRSELSFEYRMSELLRLVSTVSQGAQQTHSTQRVDPSGADLFIVVSY